jgi:glycerol-3-phosphate dehydrogenase
VINNVVEASVSLRRINSFLVCKEHKPVGPGDLSDIGIKMENASYAYESRRPKIDDVDPVAKELADKFWEVALLRAQLQEAEEYIRDLTESDVLIDESVASECVMEDTSPQNILCLKRFNFECADGEFIAVIGGKITTVVPIACHCRSHAAKSINFRRGLRKVVIFERHSRGSDTTQRLHCLKGQSFVFCAVCFHLECYSER